MERLLGSAAVVGEHPRRPDRRAGEHHLVDAVHLPPPGAHARRPPGKGATVGSVIPTLGAIMPAAVGVDIGCGMIAVQTQFTQADLRPTGGGCASRSSGPSRCRRAGTTEASRPRPSRGSPSWRRWRAGASTRRRRGQWRAAAGLARLGQPLHRGERRRDGPGLAVPALRVARAWATGSRSTTSRSPSARASGSGSPARPRPRLPRGGHARSSASTSASCAGRSASRCSTARR